MAGRRRTTGGGRPKQRLLSALRRQQSATERLSVAQTPHEQIAAAAAYAVSAAKQAPPQGTDVALVTEAIQVLTALGDRLLAAGTTKEDRR